MNRIIILLSLLTVLGCKQKNTGAELMDLSTITQGPILHDTLTSKQIENISYLYDTFKEVDPKAKEKWLEDFKRDLNPDKEIETWLMMASAYNSYCEGKNIGIDTKNEVFKIVLLRSSIPENEVLSLFKLEYLSESEAISIMKTYKLKARPLRVIQE